MISIRRACFSKSASRSRSIKVGRHFLCLCRYTVGSKEVGSDGMGHGLMDTRCSCHTVRWICLVHHATHTEEKLRSMVKELCPEVSLPDGGRKEPLKKLGRETKERLGKKAAAFKLKYDPANGHPPSGHSWSRCTECDPDEFGDELWGKTANMRTLRKRYKAEFDALKAADKPSLPGVDDASCLAA